MENIESVKSTLTRWSKETFKDIFKQLTIKEEIFMIEEKLFEEVTISKNREVLQRA